MMKPVLRILRCLFILYYCGNKNVGETGSSYMIHTAGGKVSAVLCVRGSDLSSNLSLFSTAGPTQILLYH